MPRPALRMGILTVLEVSPRGQTDTQTHLSDDKPPEQVYCLLPHLVKPESQPSLKRDGAAASSSSVRSCRNSEPGRASSSLGSTAPAAWPFGNTKVTLTVTAPPGLPLSPQQHRARSQSGVTAGGVTDAHLVATGTWQMALSAHKTPRNTQQNPLNKGSQRGRSTAGALAGELQI